MKNVFGKFARGLKRAVPIILSVGGVAGLGVTTALTVKATVKAHKIVSESEDKDKMTAKDVAVLVKGCYIPTIIAFTGTAGCIIGAAVINERRIASLGAAYAVMNASYNKYKSKVKELYGKEAHEKIISSIAAESAKPVLITSEAFCSNATLDFGDKDEEKLFYDMFSDRHFRSTVNRVLQAEYHLNRNFVLRGSTSLEEFYDFLGIETPDWAKDVGWDSYDTELMWVDFNNFKSVGDDGLEVYVIEMTFPPCGFQKESECTDEIVVCDEDDCSMTA